MRHIHSGRQRRFYLGAQLALHLLKRRCFVDLSSTRPHTAALVDERRHLHRPNGSPPVVPCHSLVSVRCTPTPAWRCVRAYSAAWANPCGGTITVAELIPPVSNASIVARFSSAHMPKSSAFTTKSLGGVALGKALLRWAGLSTREAAVGKGLLPGPTGIRSRNSRDNPRSMTITGG